MALTTIDPTPALVVIDLQKGIVAAHTDSQAAAAVKQATHLITKRRRSAFHDTGLDTLLRDLDVTQIVLAGIATSSGVESTARSASDHGYHVVLATDAMSDPDGDAHRHSTERVFPKLGETATVTDIIDMIEATR
ncbi:isochorismatase family protein [Streptomyces cyslabdanicus]|uniref:isochorismatase family protein n=1 Tax=Streptomyces cyslabdanicus TaxID=1470456 RepID=UPI004043EBC5